MKFVDLFVTGGDGLYWFLPSPWHVLRSHSGLGGFHRSRRSSAWDELRSQRSSRFADDQIEEAGPVSTEAAQPQVVDFPGVRVRWEGTDDDTPPLMNEVEFYPATPAARILPY